MKNIKTLSALIFMVLILSCNKSRFESSASNPVNQVKELSIDRLQLEEILASIHNNDRTPNWWKKFTRWINTHSGSPQQYDSYGIPKCSGNGGCGPCPGFCIFGSINEIQNDSLIELQTSILDSIKSVSFSILEKSGPEVNLKMLIEYPSYYDDDLLKNDIFIFDNDQELPSLYSYQAGYSSIKILSGEYATLKNLTSGRTFCVVNIGYED